MSKPVRHFETKHQRRRRTLLTEWTGADIPPALRANERKLSDLMPSLLSRIGIQDRNAQDRIIEDWPLIVGEHLARHSRPVALRSGILQIAVIYAPVRYDLERNHRQAILTKLTEALGPGSVKGIRFTSS